MTETFAPLPPELNDTVRALSEAFNMLRHIETGGNYSTGAWHHAMRRFADTLDKYRAD